MRDDDKNLRMSILGALFEHLQVGSLLRHAQVAYKRNTSVARAVSILPLVYS